MTTSEQTTTASDEPLPDNRLILTKENAGDVIRSLGGLDVYRSTGAASQLSIGSFIILYGQAGAGKTLLAGNSMDAEVVGGQYLHVDAEGGVDTIIDRPGLEWVPIYTWRDFDRLTADLVRQNGAGYKVICIDNLSEIADQCLFSIAGNTDSAEIQEWGEMFRMVRQKIRVYRDLARKHGIIVIMCCWDADEKEAATGIIKKDLALSPALRKQVPGLTTIIGHVRVLNDPNQRMLDFASTPKTVAKFRRSASAVAQQIPLQITYGVNNLPMADIIDVLLGGAKWPSQKYATQASNKSASGLTKA